MRWSSCAVGLCLLAALGCHSRDQRMNFGSDAYLPYAQQIEYPDACPEHIGALDVSQTQAPPSVRRPEDTEKWPLTLEDATRIALSNSQVLRNLGGQVVARPTTERTVYEPALQETNPQLGVEAALAAFDAQFSTNLFIEQRDRAANNVFAASSGLFTNDGQFDISLTKTAATGTRFGLSNVTIYNRNNTFAPGGFNLVPSFYDTLFQAEVRHPLLQGSGVEFNRIAGPNATPGNYNGVLIARINTDVSLADFEASVRNLLADVETTYWELYFAYRNFDSLVEGRRLALDSWKLEKRRADAGLRTADQEAFVREQFYAAQAGVENALSGTKNGTGGIYAVERQLRSLLGLPTSDGRLIIPTDEPATVDIRFDWHEALSLALTRRVELRRQQWTLKRRELELVAAKNFTKMRVDLVGQYRWRGFGDDLLGEGIQSIPNPAPPPAVVPINQSAMGSLLSGDLQDWRVGVEITTPVGNRQGHAAVRHAQLQLTREHAIYDEMERQISHELRSAFTELDRAYAVARSRYNQRVASFTRLSAEQKRNERGQTDLDLVLDAQRQAVTAESNYHRALTDYNLALLEVHRSRGTLLDYHGVRLAEGPWAHEAHRSAANQARRFRHKHFNYAMPTPPGVSLGEFPQRAYEAEVLEERVEPLPSPQ